MSYCLFLAQCPKKNLPSHCIAFEALCDRTRPYDTLARTDPQKNLPSHWIPFEALCDRTRPYDILARTDLLRDRWLLSPFNSILFRKTSSPILAPVRAYLGMEEILDPPRPPTVCLGLKRSRTNLIKVRGDMSYCLFLGQCPEKNSPSHCIPFEALCDRTCPYDILAGTDLLRR